MTSPLLVGMCKTSTIFVQHDTGGPAVHSETSCAPSALYCGHAMSKSVITALPEQTCAKYVPDLFSPMPVADFLALQTPVLAFEARSAASIGGKTSMHDGGRWQDGGDPQGETRTWMFRRSAE